MVALGVDMVAADMPHRLPGCHLPNQVGILVIVEDMPGAPILHGSDANHGHVRMAAQGQGVGNLLFLEHGLGDGLGGENHGYGQGGVVASQALGQHPADLRRIRHGVVGGEGADHLRHVGLAPVLERYLPHRIGHGIAVGDRNEGVGPGMFHQEGRGAAWDHIVARASRRGLGNPGIVQVETAYQLVFQVLQPLQGVSDGDGDQALVLGFLEHPRDGGP